MSTVQNLRRDSNLNPTPRECGGQASSPGFFGLPGADRRRPQSQASGEAERRRRGSDLQQQAGATGKESLAKCASKPASAFKAAQAGLILLRRFAAFCGEAEAEYAAHMAEVAEARSHQLDAEMDRYACTFAGAGYTEYLMAMEG